MEKAASPALPLESSKIRVWLDLEPRRKGLLLYSTYNVVFDGTYLYRNTGDASDVTFRVQLTGRIDWREKFAVRSDSQGNAS